MQPWEKGSSNGSRGVFIFFSEVILLGCLSVWFKPVCVSRYLIFWQDQAGLQLLTVHLSGTVAPKSSQFCFKENKVFHSCVFFRWNLPDWKPRIMLPSSSLQILRCQVSVSSKCVLVPTAAHGVEGCVHGSRCPYLGGAGAQKVLLILPALVAKNPVAPS